MATSSEYHLHIDLYYRNTVPFLFALGELEDGTFQAAIVWTPYGILLHSQLEPDHFAREMMPNFPNHLAGVPEPEIFLHFKKGPEEVIMHLTETAQMMVLPHEGGHTAPIPGKLGDFFRCLYKYLRHPALLQAPPNTSIQ